MSQTLADYPFSQYFTFYCAHCDVYHPARVKPPASAPGTPILIFVCPRPGRSETTAR